MGLGFDNRPYKFRMILVLEQYGCLGGLASPAAEQQVRVVAAGHGRAHLPAILHQAPLTIYTMRYIPSRTIKSTVQ